MPIGLVAALLAPRFLRESESHPGELDLPGAVTGTLGLLGLVYGLSRAGTERLERPLDDRQPGRRRRCCSRVFVLIESRVEHPLLPFRVFCNRTRAASFVAMFLAPAAMFAMFFFLSLYIQNVMGYSPLEAGVAFLPFCVGIVVAAGISSNLINRIDPRYPRRHRHPDGGRRPVRVLAAALRHHAPGRGASQRQLRQPTCCRSSC